MSTANDIAPPCSEVRYCVWPSKAFGKTGADWITAERVDYRHRQVELVYQHIGCALRVNDIDGYPHQFSSEFRHALQFVVAVAQHENKVASLDIPQVCEAGAERLDGKAGRLLRRDPPNASKPLCRFGYRKFREHGGCNGRNKERAALYRSRPSYREFPL
jgi:hypothetical protein